MSWLPVLITAQTEARRAQQDAADRIVRSVLIDLRARRAQTPQTAVSRGDSATMVRASTGGHATPLRRLLAALRVLVVPGR